MKLLISTQNQDVEVYDFYPERWYSPDCMVVIIMVVFFYVGRGE